MRLNGTQHKFREATVEMAYFSALFIRQHFKKRVQNIFKINFVRLSSTVWCETFVDDDNDDVMSGEKGNYMPRPPFLLMILRKVSTLEFLLSITSLCSVEQSKDAFSVYFMLMKKISWQIIARKTAFCFNHLYLHVWACRNKRHKLFLVRTMMKFIMQATSFRTVVVR